ncbi:MAG: CocE/NonD family hydrolase [Ruthenibacterium lactatiformans]
MALPLPGTGQSSGARRLRGIYAAGVVEGLCRPSALRCFHAGYVPHAYARRRGARRGRLSARGSAAARSRIACRTPYDKDDGAQTYFRYVRRGYAVVVQDVRGRNESGGEWLPHYYEVEDGDDTLTWVGTQEWCDGSVGMLGGSYLGYTQWCAAALGNPHLKAMISVVTAGTAFADGPLHGGCFSSGGFAWNFAMTKRRFAPERMDRADWDEILDIRPLEDIGQKALGEDVPFIRKMLAHPVKTVSAARQLAKRDGENGSRAHSKRMVRRQRYGHHRGVGPHRWLPAGHAQGGARALAAQRQQQVRPARPILSAGALRFDLDLLYQKWLTTSRGEENGVEQSAPVEYYTMGENRWKTASRWPVENADDTPFYFGENGTLFPICGREGRTGYTYDPQDPGTHIIDMSENEIAVPENYTQEEQSPDYICYTTPTLPAPLTVTGDARVTLYVSSDAPDTDFMVRLCDVDEAGRSVKLADGILAARFRNGFSAPEYLEPGKVEKLVIRTSKISHCFLPGHRLRVSVTSGAKHFVFPNSNTKDAYNSTESRVAHNTVWHGGAAPSHILLHVER